jgi:alpha-L-rhamnosidase
LEQEAVLYEELAEHTKSAFQKRFYNESNGSYGEGGGNILALKMGVPAGQYERVVKALRDGIRARDGHLDTGIIGTRFFFEVLAENGLQELAYEAMNQRTEPSFGRWVELGSTTTREQWDEGGSHNHPMFGGGLVWFYRNLAGMQADPEQPGYRHIIFKPQPVKEVDRVSYRTHTSFGDAGITWNWKGDQLSLEVEVPVSCTATIYFPVSGDVELLEGGRALDQAEAVELLGTDEGVVRIGVESGHYRFSAK